ncbi:hypothetical protein AK812_SmicGene21074 [Symbiodinium microadriaticum]|uniref:Uncharacterized protein n=1 Tax=Symbiodinium microadriaticum TaxID=2951 RepID=A0A1Q9DNB0_SYMMI|nr:hypothetical protein AK812_SmicGene21074 [Symbiodinium microadriaticum]
MTEITSYSVHCPDTSAGQTDLEIDSFPRQQIERSECKVLKSNRLSNIRCAASPDFYVWGNLALHKDLKAQSPVLQVAQGLVHLQGLGLVDDLASLSELNTIQISDNYDAKYSHTMNGDKDKKSRQTQLRYAWTEASMFFDEVLMEKPSAPKGRWYLAGAAVATLVLVGVVAKVSHSSLSKSKTLDEIENWEELPGMDKVVGVIHKAQALKMDRPLRNLQDLRLGSANLSACHLGGREGGEARTCLAWKFYDSQPEELPWIRTECVIDTVQAAAYLAQAVVFLYKAIDYDGLECPNNSPVGCAASVAGFITSITWIASYLSFAANACGQAVNNGALCAGDFTALMANFGEIATVGAAARADCDFGKNALQILTRTETISPPWKEFVPAGASPAVDKALKIKGHKDQQRNRDYDIVQCAADVTNSVSYIAPWSSEWVRAILQIRAAGSACADPKSCAVGIMRRGCDERNIISSFAWISQFTALAVSDCQVAADQKALCTADISDMVAALTNGPAAGIASTSDCAVDGFLGATRLVPGEAWAKAAARRARAARAKMASKSDPCFLLFAQVPMVQVEQPRASKGRWYMAGAAVMTLAVVGVVAKAWFHRE